MQRMQQMNNYKFTNYQKLNNKELDKISLFKINKVETSNFC